MSDLRQDPTTREWVIVAPDRANRPGSFKSAKTKRTLPEWDESCPFCPGNEESTLAEVFRMQDGQSGWSTRVVPNRYPALTPEGAAGRQSEEGFFTKMEGTGVHEVIVESPLHNTTFAQMDRSQVERVLFTYRARYNDLKRVGLVRFVSIFKNRGESAGTSLEHPHSQVVATPIAPPYIRRKLDIAIQYYHDMGSCLYCDLFRHELQMGTRVTMETANLAVFHPYASRSPFETWVVPKTHQPSFGLIVDEHLIELAGVLRDTLLRLDRLLDEPDFNYVICSSPAEDEQNNYHDWHLVIMPRLSKPAGFEMGSGIHINTAVPEETAALIRGVRP